LHGSGHEKFPEFGSETVGVLLVLESTDDIISVPRDNEIAASLSTSPSLGPHVSASLARLPASGTKLANVRSGASKVASAYQAIVTAANDCGVGQVCLRRR